MAGPLAYYLGAHVPSHVVDPADRLDQAAALVRQHRPDIVVLAWDTPREVNPDPLVDFVRQAKADSPQTRWLLFSDFVNPRQLRAILRLGLHSAASKRSHPANLVAAVRASVLGNPFFCPLALQAIETIHQPVLCRFTKTEQAVLIALAAAPRQRVPRLARKLGKSTKTVFNNLAFLRQKLNLHSLTDLANFALDHGMVRRPSSARHPRRPA